MSSKSTPEELATQVRETAREEGRGNIFTESLRAIHIPEVTASRKRAPGAGRKLGAAGPRKAVALSLGEKFVSVLDERASAVTGDRSSYIRRLVKRDILGAQADALRAEQPEAVVILETDDGLWDVVTPDTEFQVVQVAPKDRGPNAGVDYAYRVEGGEVVGCGPEEAEYVLGNVRLMWANESLELGVLGWEAVRRIHQGEDIIRLEVD